MQSLIFTTPRAGHSPATDEHSALRASRGGGVSTPGARLPHPYVALGQMVTEAPTRAGSRYLSQQNANRSGVCQLRYVSTLGCQLRGCDVCTRAWLDDTGVPVKAQPRRRAACLTYVCCDELKLDKR